MTLTTTHDSQSALDARPSIHDLLRQRRSPRAYADRPVDPATVRSVLEAARWAPSANNQQPWHFIVATKDDPETYNRLFDLLMDGNKRWAGNAPVLMLVVARLYKNRDGETTMRSLYDAGLATAQLTTQATALGLITHQMGGFYGDRARQAFGIPDEYEPIAAIALGYPGDHEALPDDLRERELAPRTRKPLDEFVYGTRWGKTSPVLG